MSVDRYDLGYVYQAVCRITHLLNANLKLSKRQSLWSSDSVPAWVKEVSRLKLFLERYLIEVKK